MFYLKYRPKTIEEIDSLKVREAIEKILQSKNLPHAFLFIGQKGTGKTSVARIFAKAVNCLNNKFTQNLNQSINPCNRCQNCVSINSSSSPDVLELDAASNRGINEVKNLIRESSFSPMTCRFRIFIIDEAHMITHDGFNALLKTLEEPPPSVIFILATTNPEKIPKTISSRCFIVNFDRAKKEEIKNMLKRIAIGEKLSFDSSLFDLIATHSEKSFRDAAKLLEELVIQKKLDPLEAQAYLGVRSKQSLLEVLQNKSLKEALSWIEEFFQKGGNFKNLIEELLEELRLLLLSKNNLAIDEEIDLDFSIAEITLLMKLLNEAYVGLKTTPIEAIPLEIAIIEFYNERNKKN